MPVVGHALVGLATAMSVRPSAKLQVPSPYWCPYIVALAYLPDIANQIAMFLGARQHNAITHSVFVAIVVSPIIATCAARLMSVALGRIWIVTLLTILIHDGLDFLQRPSRQICWPLTTGRFHFGVEVIPTGPRAEATAFGIAFAIFLVGFIIALRLRKPKTEPSVPHASRNVWIGRSLALAIVACACITHQLRAARESKYRQMHNLLRRHEYQAVLDAVERSERWPSVTRPARLDYARAEAYLGLGDRAKAERFYLRSYEGDPDYFWVVGDLAVFYAGSDEPAEQRKRRAAPYLAELKERFADHPQLSGVVARIERKLRR